MNVGRPDINLEMGESYVEETDLDRMLDPLRRLANLGGIQPAAAAYLGADGQPIEVWVEFELDRDAPHLDFVSQFMEMLRDLTCQRGVVLSPHLVGKLARVAAHAGAVASMQSDVARG